MPLCWSAQTFLNETTASGAVSVANLRPARVEFRNDVCEARGTGFCLVAADKRADFIVIEIDITKPLSYCHLADAGATFHHIQALGHTVGHRVSYALAVKGIYSILIAIASLGDT